MKLPNTVNRHVLVGASVLITAAVLAAVITLLERGLFETAPRAAESSPVAEPVPAAPVPGNTAANSTAAEPAAPHGALLALHSGRDFLRPLQSS